MTAKLLMLALALTLAAPAQEKPAETPKPRQTGVRYIQRVYQVKHVDSEELLRLAYTTPSGQGQTPILRSSRALKAITVYGTSDEANSIIENLKLLDVPDNAPASGPRNFELTLTILVAAPQSAELPGAAVPQSLSAVTAELQRVFGLKEFRLLEASVLRASEGQRMGSFGNAGPIGAYNLYYRPQVVGPAGNAVVKVSEFNFGLNTKSGQIRFETAFDLKEGQQVVVGKANDGTDRSIILVLSARIPQ